MSTETDPVYITTPTPFDTSGIRDPGMAALAILAVTFGWNVLKKPNNPLVITARSGFQKRLPTDTSIRMSVFQTTLASILLYSAPMRPTPELMEAIIKLTKPDAEHARRLRLVVGESDMVLADRVNNAQASIKGEEEEVAQAVEPDPASVNKDLALYGDDTWDRKVHSLPPLMMRAPTPGDMNNWMMDLKEKLEPDVIRRSGMVVYLTFGNREILWCAFPGCRYCITDKEDPWLIRGHNRKHTGQWGPLSDTPGAKTRLAKKLREDGYATSGRSRAQAAERLGVELPEVMPALEPKRKAEPVTGGQPTNAEAATAPIEGDDLVESLNEKVMMLLEVATGLVDVVAIATKALADRSSTARVVALEAENKLLRERADKYDLLMEVLRK